MVVQVEVIATKRGSCKVGCGASMYRLGLPLCPAGLQRLLVASVGHVFGRHVATWRSVMGLTQLRKLLLQLFQLVVRGKDGAGQRIIHTACIFKHCLLNQAEFLVAGVRLEGSMVKAVTVFAPSKMDQSKNSPNCQFLPWRSNRRVGERMRNSFFT